MKKAEKLLREICRDVKRPLEEQRITPRYVDDQLYELQLLALELNRLALRVRQNGCTHDAFNHALYEVVR